jgi:hypothetical protein
MKLGLYDIWAVGDKTRVESAILEYLVVLYIVRVAPAPYILGVVLYISLNCASVKL